MEKVEARFLCWSNVRIRYRSTTITISPSSPFINYIYFCHISPWTPNTNDNCIVLCTAIQSQLASAQLYQNIQFIDFISCAWLFTLHGSLHVHRSVIHMHIMYTFFLSTLQNYYIYQPHHTRYARVVRLFFLAKKKIMCFYFENLIYKCFFFFYESNL